eukprot:CAMPEP_0203774142 /NCGR_PEP_ID=MMETSP0099_2-20121227/5108_1 /ASSEMBLY_ACC=CAM_ASM_000209 /TAXON_ID=96639 /ORGANISM=" , Strain NY0313808BC1" /LENGTH=316 /DNA_ID=CAMNT_0050672169 /DNA_START=405 /DNA_END=1355 /DNA_ORIENTATION=-
MNDGSGGNTRRLFDRTQRQGNEHLDDILHTAEGLSVVFSNEDIDDISDLLVNQLHDTYMEEQIPSHPVSRRHFNSLERLKGPCGSCSVCIEQYTKIDCCIKLPCGHVFHEKCVGRWFVDQHTCPTCRYELVEQTESEENELLLERREAQMEESILECAAAAAAGCAGCPSAFFDMIDMDFDAREHEFEYTEEQNHEVVLQEQLFQRLFQQMNSMQIRNELESRNRVRQRLNSGHSSESTLYGNEFQSRDNHNPSGSSSEGNDYETIIIDDQNTSEATIRELFDRMNIDHSQCETREELLRLARIYFVDDSVSGVPN